MEWIRVFRGKVIGIEHIGTSAFGMRTYKIVFASGSAYYQWPSKRTLPVAVGETIRFTGHEVSCPEPYFFIDEVVDSTYMDKLEAANYYNQIMAEHIQNES